MYTSTERTLTTDGGERTSGGEERLIRSDIRINPREFGVCPVPGERLRLDVTFCAKVRGEQVLENDALSVEQ